MSQVDIDAFICASIRDTLTPEGVTAAVATRRIPVNGRHSRSGLTALHWAVHRKRPELVVTLLATGADANVKVNGGGTPVYWGASVSTADILQLLIDGGGNVNEMNICGQTPLINLVKFNSGDKAARLQVLLACPELALDAKDYGKTAEEWAVHKRHPELAMAIVEGRLRRMRWSALRSAWIAAITVATVAP